MDSPCPTVSGKLLAKIMTTAQAIERARDVIRRHHKALSTEEPYVFWLRRYML
jgi:hypothetical protein